MMIWVFSIIVLGSAATAALADNMRRATLAFWIAGFAMGCLYLSLGAEALAVIQWLVSTLVSISLFFFAVMFGEYDRAQTRPTPVQEGEPKFFGLGGAPARLLGLSLALLVGGAFSFMAYLGSAPISPEMISLPKEGNDLTAVGAVLSKHHLLSLEVLALTLFLVLVGGGVIARPEAAEEPKGDGR